MENTHLLLYQRMIKELLKPLVPYVNINEGSEC